MTTSNLPTQAPQDPLRLQVKQEIISTLHNASTQSPSRRIRFYHPHYPYPSNLLLDLHAPDGPNGGLDYTFAHTACGLIAGNRWDGYFSHDVGAQQRLQLEQGDILPLGDYFFQLDDSSTENPYATFPTFRAWTFPHNRLPPLWSPETNGQPTPILGRLHASSNFKDAVFINNKTCRISDTEEATDVAHLCPRTELDWAQRNSMGIYNTSPSVPVDKQLDDTGNALLLREDLHTLFDRNNFVFTPKMDEEGKIAIVIHVLDLSRELEYFYHNVRLKPAPNVHQCYFLTRFAWSIFKFFEHFVTNGVDRKLLIGSSISKMFSPKECKNFIIRGRNASPTKQPKRSVPEDDNSFVDAEVQHREKCQRIDQQSFESSSVQSQVTAIDEYLTTASTGKGPETTQAIKQPMQIQMLREEWLKTERQRSDPDNAWAEETKWIESVWDGKVVMGPGETERFSDFYS